MKSIRDPGLLEFIFGIFLASLIVLGNFYPGRFSDGVLASLLLILIFNFACLMDFKARPAERGSFAVYLVVNTLGIAVLLRQTGGRDSIFWVAFLQPVLCAAAAAEGAGPWPIVALAALLLGAGYVGTSPGPADALEWGVKSSVLAFAAALTRRGSRREARLREEIERKRLHLQYLAGRLVEENEPVDARGDLSERIERRLRKIENPLTLIEASARLAQLQAPEAEADFKRIEACQRLIRGLARDLFDVLYRDEYWMEMTSFEDLYRKVLHELRYPLAVKELRFQESIQPELPKAPLSRRHMEEFLYGLLERAIAECAPGQTLKVDVRPALRAAEPCLEAVFEHPGLCEPSLRLHLKAIAQRHGGLLGFADLTRAVRYSLFLPLRRGAVLPIVD